MSRDSPFQLSDKDVRTIEASEGFRIVSSYLTEESGCSFCHEHSDLPLASKDTFLLHRTILHAALLPLLQIHAQAATFALRILPKRRATDLELAFRGDARGAFSWLQCFIAEEEEWCSTRGCPACIVLRVLHSEPFIRILVVACRLSEYLQSLIGASGPQLPDFGFLVYATVTAVEGDEFWGPGFWEEIDSRAERLELGVKDLIHQCCEVRDISQVQKRCVSAGTTNCNVKNSTMASRQLMLKREEQDWMRAIIRAVWSTLLQDAARERRMVSSSRRLMPAPRMRSLTT